MRRAFPLVAMAAFLAHPAIATRAADLATLTPDTWDDYAPNGKEADAIYGDFVLRNDRIVAVIAQAIPGRNANMTVRNVGGCLIDLTTRDRQSDQLSAFYPGGSQLAWTFAGLGTLNGSGTTEKTDERVLIEGQGEEVSISFHATPAEGLLVVANYKLRDGQPFIEVVTTFFNRGEAVVGVDLFDEIRADRSFEKAADGTTDLFWAYDEWFGQAYGLVAEGHEIQGASDARKSTLRYLADGKARIEIRPGQSYVVTRRIIPAGSLLEVKGIAAALDGQETTQVLAKVTDGSGSVVQNARVELLKDGEPYASGRTGPQGALLFDVPAEGGFTAAVSAIGRGERTGLELGERGLLDVVLEEPGYVAATINDSEGGPIPCKVQFLGKDGVEDPFFGPDSGEHAVQNAYYSHDGRFRQALAPGRYDVIVSYGPEYDAVFTEIEIRRGEETPLTARLVRSVDTSGWISSDFHSHSSPSGDNTASQYGRVLNLLCEHIEFAPCTEHNRLSTYVPHLETMGVEHLMATCTGLELTGSPLPLNHQNAFPLELKPRTQDNGAPLTDESPEAQIERLALWDNNAEKLVQVNHPDLGWMFHDRDGDYSPDEGFAKMIGFMDVIEIQQPYQILDPAIVERNGMLYNNTIVNWLQLLNQGHRIPGVSNTDAHYNFHGSGWLRNWLKSPTDRPAEVDTLDMVRAAEAGHVVMSTGPFLMVSLAASGEESVIPGDAIAAPSGQAELSVQVQCPNWFDINRVQVLLNGRPVEALNHTRESTPDHFGDGTVKFERTIPLVLDADTHVIVVAIGEGLGLGPVFGPVMGKIPPVAVSNPIYMDVDGGGFTPNRDTLGAPLPVKGGRPVEASEPAGSR